MSDPSRKRVQQNAAGDRADIHSWQPGMAALRDGWPDTVVVLTVPHPCAGDRLVQISQGGDVHWVSIQELRLPDDHHVPPICLGQGDERRDLWLASQRPVRPGPARRSALRATAIAAGIVCLYGAAIGALSMVAAAFAG